MDCAFFLALWVDVRGNSLEYNDVVLLDDVDDLALDVGEAFLDQRRFDERGWQRREPESGEFVGIGPRASAYADNPVQQVDGGNRNDAFPMFAQGREGVVPAARGHGEYRREIRHHGPGDGHDVVSIAIIGCHEDHRPGFHHSKSLAQFQLTHESISDRHAKLTHLTPELSRAAKRRRLE